MRRLVVNACARKESNTYKIFEALANLKGWTSDDYEMLNLYEEPIPYLDEEMLNERAENVYTSENGLIEKRLVEQFENCEQVIFIYPSWNWSIPAVLKAYIDLILISKRTFVMKGPRAIGLTKVKQAVLINTMGGLSLPKAIAYLFNVNTDIFYLKNIVKILGIKSIVKIRLGGFGYKYIEKEEALKHDIEKLVKKKSPRIL